ncbi:putative O-glycosylation ligase, exosortase A system-associated [Methylomonas sp. SURF-2]|uniref:O-glycosylation ligase, exosortase A system-associated n=1 Tax=Methylomonas subterranea TaxID=2952225 RepID=A0ABT1TCB6_9GAMM|nr:putative O-glycosylation ligase, exosortase A system-associated [Methylomonas sp. SURF-2]MCQ8103102.1 putative O-glycosylation ligase, exosortase A system-associated [Methylomonas sp. SURF-2]
MRDIVLVLVFLGLFPKMLYQPFIGILVWIWLAFMMPQSLAYGFARSIPFSVLTAAAILFSTLISTERKRLPLTLLTVLLIIFNIWMQTTTLFALYPEDARVVASTTVKAQLINFICIMLTSSYERIKQILWVVVLSIGFYMLKGGVFALVTAGNYMVMGPEGSYLDGNNNIGLVAAMLVPLIRFLQMDDSRVWVKRCLVFLMICCLLVSAASYSRGAMLAAIAMGGFLWLKGTNKLPILILVLLSGATLLQFMPDRWKSRMDTVETYEEDASAMGRINAWEMSWNLAKDYPFGAGFECGARPELFMLYAPDPTDSHDFHSNYFSVLAHHGYLGLGLYFAIMFVAWRTGSRIIKKSELFPDTAWMGKLAAMIQVSLIGYWVGGTFLNLAYWDLPYLLIGLLIVLQRMLNDRISMKEDSDSGRLYAPISVRTLTR